MGVRVGENRQLGSGSERPAEAGARASGLHGQHRGGARYLAS